MVRTIYQQLSPVEVHGQLDRVVEQLRELFAQVAELLADAAPDILACTAFPVAHWQKLWSNNPQERLNREIRRRRACPRKGTWWASSPTGYRRGAWWARCWPNNTTNGPKPAATSPSPTPSATRHCRSPICWKQRPDQHQKGRRAFTLLDGTLPDNVLLEWENSLEPLVRGLPPFARVKDELRPQVEALLGPVGQ